MEFFALDTRNARQPSIKLNAHYAKREFMAQPFLSHVVTEGEFSLSYFNGKLSHTILKTPRAHDFRVQEEHGGVIRAGPGGERVTRSRQHRFACARFRPALRPRRLRARESWTRLLADGTGTYRTFALPADGCGSAGALRPGSARAVEQPNLTSQGADFLVPKLPFGNEPRCRRNSVSSSDRKREFGSEEPA